MNKVLRVLLLLGISGIAGAAQAVDCDAVRARFQCPADVKFPLHLSFDDGPALQTAAVLDVLKQAQVPATFFVIASKIECDEIARQCEANGGRYVDEADHGKPDAEVKSVDCRTAVQQCGQRKQILQRAKREGHVIGSHSYQHLHYSQESPQVRREHFRLARVLLDPYLNTSPPLFRLPYGDGWFTREQDGSTMQALKQAGFQHIAWQFSAFDWDEKNQQGDKILVNVLGQVCHRQQGGVVLFHDGVQDRMHEGRTYTTAHLKEWLPPLRCVVDFKPLSFFEKGYTPRR